MSNDRLGIVKLCTVDELDGAYCILFILPGTSRRFLNIDLEQKSLPTLLTILPGFGIVSMGTDRRLSMSTI